MRLAKKGVFTTLSLVRNAFCARKLSDKLLRCLTLCGLSHLSGIHTWRLVAFVADNYVFIILEGAAIFLID